MRVLGFLYAGKWTSPQPTSYLPLSPGRAVPPSMLGDELILDFPVVLWIYILATVIVQETRKLG